MEKEAQMFCSLPEVRSVSSLGFALLTMLAEREDGGSAPGV